MQLLIDVKSDSVATLNKLIEVLNNYPAIINCHEIKITISGSRPAMRIIMEGNVMSFGVAVNKRFKPYLYSYDPYKIPLGIYDAVLDF